MQIRADRSLAALVDTTRENFVASPEVGVDRIMLERDGTEVAIATSIVRYARGASFGRHVHERGEEFLVLDGELRDEHGTYGKGAYVRNAWGTAHAPSSPSGCVLFVKLRQLDHTDASLVVQNTFTTCALSIDESVLFESKHVSRLYESTREEVSLVRCAPSAMIPRDTNVLEELLVLEGSLVGENDAVLRAGTWIRSPASAARRSWSTEEGALFYRKRVRSKV